MNYQGAIQHILGRLKGELPNHYYYHGRHHTIDVLGAVERIAEHEGVTDSELNLLKVAAAYHDCGFLFGHVEHEERGCEIARETLPKFGFNEESVKSVERMIMATKIPQSPLDRLSEILCDADLDYLGRDDFEPIATSLFKELEKLDIVSDIKTWNRIQLGFLSKHTYRTAYGQQLREPAKQKHLQEIQVIVDGYDD